MPLDSNPSPRITTGVFPVPLTDAKCDDFPG